MVKLWRSYDRRAEFPEPFGYKSKNGGTHEITKVNVKTVNALQPFDGRIRVSFRQSQKKALGALEGMRLWEVDQLRFHE
ncbi:hypothetical protein PI86_01865 [Burkholderia sp. A9]|uniref:hypothetical protein n=1 Tax=Burkholderia sp. A9 TaxID=1365108 RepID=UPI000574D7A5|nr:hypothetical protein [Burkholderia sp. A9]KHK60927.1 hypothetical protein PI86_01865 [Burkholderia sp. A9]